MLHHRDLSLGIVRATMENEGIATVTTRVALHCLASMPDMILISQEFAEAANNGSVRDCAGAVNQQHGFMSLDWCTLKDRSLVSGANSVL